MRCFRQHWPVSTPERRISSHPTRWYRRWNPRICQPVRARRCPSSRLLAALVHLPSRLFTSPFQLIAGPGPEFFAVYLYIVDPSNGALRWQFVAPWAPAAGMLGNMMFVFACFETDKRLRAVALFTAVMICLMTKSRMAMLFLVV